MCRASLRASRSTARSRSRRPACACSASRSPFRVDTPFRIASITKPFTATLAARCLELDDALCALPEPHGRPPLRVGGRRCPESCRRRSGRTRTPATGRRARRAAEACGSSVRGCDARARARAARARGDRLRRACRRRRAGTCRTARPGSAPCSVDAYPVARRPSGGLWSTVADLAALRRAPARRARTRRCTSRARPRSARSYALGWWVRDLGGRIALDHEGSVGGLPVAPPARAGGEARARRAHEQLARQRRDPPHRRRARSRAASPPRRSRAPEAVAGVYALDGVEAHDRARRPTGCA